MRPVAGEQGDVLEQRRFILERHLGDAGNLNFQLGDLAGRRGRLFQQPMADIAGEPRHRHHARVQALGPARIGCPDAEDHDLGPIHRGSLDNNLRLRDEPRDGADKVLEVDIARGDARRRVGDAARGDIVEPQLRKAVDGQLALLPFIRWVSERLDKMHF